MDLVLEPWAITTLLICFGGGIVGTAIGALFAFIMCGVIVLTGCLVVMCGGGDFLLMQVGLGPIWGPHVGGFIAGAIAGTYAAGIKKNHPNWAGLGGKDILSPLIGTSWDVMVVGGLGAVATHAVFQLLLVIPIIQKFDCIALALVLTAMLARGLFQKQAPWGDSESIKKHGYLGTDNHAISWVPWMAPWRLLVVYGFGWGLLSGGLAWGTKTMLDPMVVEGSVSATGAFVVPLIIGWSLAAIMLIGLNLAADLLQGGTIQKFPVQHHNAILGALAYLYWGNILIAGIVGLLAALLGELMARMFWNHGSNHIDPPACAIAVGTFLLYLASLIF